MQVENRCRITGVTNPIHLRARHCKPLRDSSNDERINGENGLLLTPTMDHLFDRGFISLEDSGLLIVSPVANPPSLNLMGVATTDRIINLGTFTQGQEQFLDYHPGIGSIASSPLEFRLIISDRGWDRNYGKLAANRSLGDGSHCKCVRVALPRRFSELAVFDARLYIRVRRIDEPA
jgi:HNH endonuclease